MLRRLTGIITLCLALALFACGGNDGPPRSTETTTPASPPQPLTLHLADQSIGLRPALKIFEETNNIRLTIVEAPPHELAARFLESVQGGTADVIVSDDVADLLMVKDQGGLQPFSTPALEKNIGEMFWGTGSYWFAFMQDVDVLSALIDRVEHTELDVYEDLVKTKWKGQLLMPDRARMQNVLAQMLITEGTTKTERWLKAAKEHLALPANLSDEDLVRALGDEKGTVALLSAAAQIRLHRSGNPVEDARGDKIGIKIPVNAQNSTYYNLAGLAVAKNAPHRTAAMLLAEFLSDQHNQDKLSYSMEMYPVNPFSVPSEFLIDIGGFNPPDFSWELYRQKHKEAGALLDKYDWPTP